MFCILTIVSSNPWSEGHLPFFLLFNQSTINVNSIITHAAHEHVPNIFKENLIQLDEWLYECENIIVAINMVEY